MNKIDHGAGWDIAGAVKVSAKNGDGMEEFFHAIHHKLRVEIDERRIGWWTRRQRMLLCSVGVPPT